MDPGSIVAICVAGISAISSLLTIGYVGYKSSFGDKQDTTITITDEFHYPNGAGLAVRKQVTFKVDDFDSYQTQSFEFKNGKQEVSATNVKTPINIDASAGGKGVVAVASETTYLGSSSQTSSPRVIAKSSSDGKSDSQPSDSVIRLSDLQAVLDNDFKGEQVASQMRQLSLSEVIKSYRIGVSKATELVEYFIYYNNSYNASLMGANENQGDTSEIV